MTPIQQLMLGAGGGKKVVGIDDVFKTYVYEGNQTAKSINTGLDMTDGGMVWIKNRDNSWSHRIWDTERGSTKFVYPNDSNAQENDANGTTATMLESFNNNGFSVGQDQSYGGSNYGDSFVSWSFKKQEKFFTTKTYSGTNSTLTMTHDLGSVPGAIFVKRTDSATDWSVYHRSLGSGKRLRLNLNNEAQNSNAFSAAPTATHFTVDVTTGNEANGAGGTFVAYLFAGGESTASEAVSVDFDGTGDYLTSDQSTNYAMGTGDFTVEGWFKRNSGSNFGYFMNSTSGLSGSYGVSIHYYTTYGLSYYAGGTKIDTNFHPPDGQWFHLALVRNSGTTSLYYNGELKKAAADNTDYTGERFVIGGYDSSSYVLNGSVSNFRVVKGTAVYTSSFRPPTEPLTNITNTKLLCCNNSSVTGTTTGTVTSAGDPTASTDSPFDDPAGFAFGPNSDQNLISCGSYIGTGSAGISVTLPFEPQYLLIKNATDSSSYWMLFDSMRGVTTGGNSSALYPNGNDVEDTATDYIDFTSTGFKVTIGNNTEVNKSGSTHCYMAIAAETGRTINSKNITAGTDVFSIDAAGSAGSPAFDSSHVVDMVLMKKPTVSHEWRLSTRLTAGKRLVVNSSSSESSDSDMPFDYQNGAFQNYDSPYQAWMWKRHAGFDALCYGPSTGTTAMDIPHNCGQIPEMIWVKVRDDNRSWAVYHKGLNGGTNPEQYWLSLDDITDAEIDSNNIWNDTAPSATHFTVGIGYPVNLPANSNRIALLFSSVAGISKVGSWTGSGSTQTITVGFAPRFLLWRRANAVEKWYVVDTTRGWTSSGSEPYLQLNSSNAQANTNLGDISATGFTVTSGDNWQNNSGDTYIYYCHA